MTLLFLLSAAVLLSLGSAQLSVGCDVPLCQRSYGGECGDIPCCNAAQACLRHASGCNTTLSLSQLCTFTGGVVSSGDIVTTRLQPYHPSEIFVVCGRAVETNVPQTNYGYGPDAIFRVCENQYDGTSMCA